MVGDGPSGNVNEFEDALRSRMAVLAAEWATRLGEYPDVGSFDQFVLPVGLLLMIDEANGGDATAQELIRRFHLLHQESSDIVDFYFMGWSWVDYGDRSKGIRFDLDTFAECRRALKRAGVKKFGGNADLIL